MSRIAPDRDPQIVRSTVAHLPPPASLCPIMPLFGRANPKDREDGLIGEFWACWTWSS
jgi:hypothetical protein